MDILPTSDLQASLLVGAILVIDDNLDIREALTEMLGLMTNRMVFAAANGHEGMEIVRQQRPNLGLILLDMNMPVMNGEQTYAQLQEIAPEVKVIISSSLSHIEIAYRLGTHTMPTILQKPYKIETLFSTVKLALGII